MKAPRCLQLKAGSRIISPGESPRKMAGVRLFSREALLKAGAAIRGQQSSSNYTEMMIADRRYAGRADHHGHIRVLHGDTVSYVA